MTIDYCNLSGHSCDVKTRKTSMQRAVDPSKFIHSADMPAELSYMAGPDEPPVLDMTVGDLLRRAVAMAPDRPAIIEGVAGPGRRRWTYAELLRDAEAAARALLARSQPGDHVAIWAPNIPEYTVFQCGAALAGLVMVTVNPTFRPAEVAFSLAQSRA